MRHRHLAPSHTRPHEHSCTHLARHTCRLSHVLRPSAGYARRSWTNVRRNDRRARSGDLPDADCQGLAEDPKYGSRCLSGSPTRWQMGQNDRASGAPKRPRLDRHPSARRGKPSAKLRKGLKRGHRRAVRASPAQFRRASGAVSPANKAPSSCRRRVGGSNFCAAMSVTKRPRARQASPA
jgi:hypothetical protein